MSTEKTLTDVQQLSCLQQDFTTDAKTQEGAAIRLVEHYINTHPGGLPDVIHEKLDPIIEGLKARYH